MPSKKKTTRTAQLQPQPAHQPAHSDYDTDAAVTDAAAPTMAPPPTRSNTELNLLVLRRYVPDIEAIIAIAPFAVVYHFSEAAGGWEKSGHEGTLFVCQLAADESGYARYNVVILNRKSLDNFIVELRSGEDVEITEEYVILQVQGEDGVLAGIYGLWLFEDGEDGTSTRTVVANAIQECAVRAEYASMGGNGGPNGHQQVGEYNLDGAVEDVTPVQPPQHAGESIDLLSLFNKPSVSPMQPAPLSAPQQQQPGQGARFASSADTDFFRTSASPVATAQPQHQASQQQNALLGLFKSAKKG